MESDSIILYIFFLLCSAYFAASETAYTAVSKVRLRTMADKGNKRAKKALWVCEHFDKTLTTVLIGNNIFHASCASLSALLVLRQFGQEAVVYGTVVTTVIVYLFAEMIPKSLAKARSEEIALLFASSMTLLVQICTPISFIFSGISNLLSKFVGSEDDETMTEEDLLNIIETIEDEGVLEPEKQALVNSAIEFSTKLAQDIMIPMDRVISVSSVMPLKELAGLASRFGILNTNPDNSIYEFEEKPKQPKSTNASMGIYVFNWNVLRDALLADEDDPNSSNDFGKNIIPHLLNSGHKMMAYPFDGYWKDVGTIDSLWEANMELLGKNPAFDIRGDEKFKIYARNSASPSSYIDEDAVTAGCFIAEGSEVYGTVRHSIISVGCSIGKGAIVEDSVVMPGVVIEPGAIVRHAILGEKSRICRNAVVGGSFGTKDKIKISVTSKGSTLAENAVLMPGDML